MGEMRNKIKRFYVIILMLSAGVLLWLSKIHSLEGGPVLGGVVLLISNLYYTGKPETEIIVDERIKKVDDRAGHYAFWITLSLLSAIFWMYFFKPLRASLKEVYEIVLLVGIYSWIFLRFYFSRKGFG